MAQKRILGRLFSSLWHIFLNGLFAILPITITVGVFTFTFRTILEWLKPVRALLEQRFPEVIGAIPYVEILLIAATILAIGTLLNMLIIRSVVHSIEDLIIKIPLVRPVYGGVRQLVQAFSVQDKPSFKKVVMIEFPRPGIYSVGFLTSELPKEISPTKDKKYFNVFVPTTPNPTTGYFVLIPEQDIVVINITRQEAMAMIISGGIIQPEDVREGTSPLNGKQ